MKTGDMVIVDKEYLNGGYEAEIVTIYGNYFARIKVGEEEWDIMKRRLTIKQ